MSLHAGDRRLYLRAQLYTIARAKRSMGHNYVQLVAERARKPGGRIRIFPGAPVALFGRVVGEIEKHRYLIDVSIDDIEKAEARESESNSPDHEKGDG